MNSNSEIVEASSKSCVKRDFGTVAVMFLFTACVAVVTYDAVLLVSMQDSESEGGHIVAWLASFHPPLDSSYSPWRERVDSVALALSIITPVGWLALLTGMVYLIWNAKFSAKSKLACCLTLGAMCVVFFDALTVVLD